MKLPEHSVELARMHWVCGNIGVHRNQSGVDQESPTVSALDDVLPRIILGEPAAVGGRDATHF